MTGPPPDEAPITTWRLATASAQAFGAEVATLEDLHAVLQCCERLLGELAVAEPRPPGLDAVVGSLWTTAVAAYQRCFLPRDDAEAAVPLGEQDVLDTHPDQPDVVDWHRALVGLDPPELSRAPDVTYAVGVVRGDDGVPLGVAVTSPPRLLPDEVVVRSAGTIAYALSVLVETRIGAHQAELFAEVEVLSSADLDQLPRLTATSGPSRR